MPGVDRFSSAGSAAFALRQTHVQKRYSSGALAHSVSDIRCGGGASGSSIMNVCAPTGYCTPCWDGALPPRRLGPQLLPAFPAGQYRLVLAAALVWMLRLLNVRWLVFRWTRIR